MCVCITSFNLKINQRYLASILDLAVKYCPYHFTDTIIEICSTQNIETNILNSFVCQIAQFLYLRWSLAVILDFNQ